MAPYSHNLFSEFKAFLLPGLWKLLLDWNPMLPKRTARELSS